MPVRYQQDTKAEAIGLVGDHAGDYPSEYAAITAVAGRLGMPRRRCASGSARPPSMRARRRR